MHPPSPTQPEDPSTGVLHLIRDVRNLSIEDEDEGRRSALACGQMLEQNLCPSPTPHDRESATPMQVSSLDPAMAMLGLEESEDTMACHGVDSTIQQSAIILEHHEPSSDLSFMAAFADDLHLLFPPTRLNGSLETPSSRDGAPDAEMNPGPSSSSSPHPSRRKRQRRRRRVTSGSPTCVLSLDYTHHPLSKRYPSRKAFYQPIQPPSAASFFRLPSLRRRSTSAPTPSLHDSRFLNAPSPDPPLPSGSMGVMAGYPDYITRLVDALGEEENVYPLWYLILTFWFPAQEGYEVVNGWTPRVPNENGPGCEVGLFRPIEATLAVIWKGCVGGPTSPVVVVQISPEHSTTTIPDSKSKMKRSAEILFGDAALYSQLPTLCVLSVINRTSWGGFVRSTDATAETERLTLEQEVGAWDWFGPGWEEGSYTDDCFGGLEEYTNRCGGQRGRNPTTSKTVEGVREWESVVSPQAFEILGRCFSALKFNSTQG